VPAPRPKYQPGPIAKQVLVSAKIAAAAPICFIFTNICEVLSMLKSTNKNREGGRECPEKKCGQKTVFLVEWCGLSVDQSTVEKSITIINKIDMPLNFHIKNNKLCSY
jgi:hypothetical protein